MKTKSLFFTIIMSLGIFCLTGLTFSAEKKTEEIKVINKIVTITVVDGLRPAKITSQSGTTVIWVNQSRFPIEILFLDKKVVLSCGSPVNFFVSEDGTYESNKIPSGGTASLCFMEKGKYEYKVKSSTTFYTGRIERGNQGIIWIK